MLILAHRSDFPDHAMDQPISWQQCDGTWWFSCAFTAKEGKVKVPCGRRHRVSCAGGKHISLELAEAALRQAGWRLAPAAEGGGWRCPAHTP